MLRRSPVVALVCALAIGCSPLEETAEGFRLTEGDSFVVPKGERWEVDTLGLESDSVAAVLLKVDGATWLTLWPVRDGRRVELAKRIRVLGDTSIEVVGGDANAADVYCLLRRAPETAPGSGTRATAVAASALPEESPLLTRVARADTGEFARASAWFTSGTGYADVGPVRDVVLWAFWDDGLVVFRTEPSAASGEYEVGRVSTARVEELRKSWRAFVLSPPSGSLGIFGFHSTIHHIAVRDDLQLLETRSDRAMWREWITSDRRPHEFERDPEAALSELHADVYDAAREGVACELPTLTLDGSGRPAFDDGEPVIRAKR
ncbi:MAG: hypothetical protein HZA52_09685 [Planctomycetes bacterium]|nr:hypothetical protein [Planctomycetota bacterium]